MLVKASARAKLELVKRIRKTDNNSSRFRRDMSGLLWYLSLVKRWHWHIEFPPFRVWHPHNGLKNGTHRWTGRNLVCGFLGHVSYRH
jgi:hypothetical protein